MANHALEQTAVMAVLEAMEQIIPAVAVAVVLLAAVVTPAVLVVLVVLVLSSSRM